MNPNEAKNTPVTAVNQKPPPAPARAVPKSVLEGGKLPEAIPVKRILLAKMQKVGRDHGCEAIECKDATPNQARWTATYITRMAQFEIMFHPADPKHEVEVCFLGLDKVAHWVPA